VTPTSDDIAKLQRSLGDAPYRLLHRIGAGAMGEVYAAKHSRVGRPLVVKIMKSHISASAHDRMRLEGQMLGALQHEGIVEVLDLGTTTDDHRPFLVMERLTGRGLDEVLHQEGTLEVARAVDIAKQTLRTLAHIHAAGVIHRDIKPANLFLVEPGTLGEKVKMLDFGIAKLAAELSGIEQLGDGTRSGAAMGTPKFMSPEQAKGKVVDARSDVYSAGMLLYRMLAGRTAFEHHGDMMAMMFAQVSEAPEPPSTHAPRPIPPELDAIVLRALAKLPGDRYPDAQAMHEELAALAPAPPSVEPVAASSTAATALSAPAAASPSVAAPSAAAPPVDPTEPMMAAAAPAQHVASTRVSLAREAIDPAGASTLEPVASTYAGDVPGGRKLLAVFAASLVLSLLAGVVAALLRGGLG
jgi:serine/threonine-protein kinase